MKATLQIEPKPKSSSPTTPSFTATRSSLLQRKCACGGTPGPSGKCEGCRKKRQVALQRHSVNSSEPVPRHDDPAREGPLQLIVSDPASPMEVEADRMAERVVNSRRVGARVSRSTALTVQRQAETDSLNDSKDEDLDVDEEEVQMEEPESMGDESGRPKLVAEASTQAGAHQIAIPDTPGTPLDGGARTFMESRFGHDFSGVRVHTDRVAARSAHDLQAHAYTVGRHIYFNENRYDPESLAGKRLLAHELTHVVQQTRGSDLTIQRAPEQTRRRPKGRRDPPTLKVPRRKRAEKQKPCATGECDGNCAAPAEKAVRHAEKCGNEICADGAAADASNFIRHLDVHLGTQMVTAELGTATKTNSTDVFLSSPRPGGTPRGRHKIGLKCGACHTNRDAHGMGWFTSFHNTYEYGFHNSQKVAKGVRSAGCVRVAPCDKAKWIHDNTASGITTVCVHTGDHCKTKASKGAKKKKGKSSPKQSSLGAPGPSAPGDAPSVADAEPAAMDMDETEEAVT